MNHDSVRVLVKLLSPNPVLTLFLPYEWLSGLEIIIFFDFCVCLDDPAPASPLVPGIRPDLSAIFPQPWRQQAGTSNMSPDFQSTPTLLELTPPPPSRVDLGIQKPYFRNQPCMIIEWF